MKNSMIKIIGWVTNVLGPKLLKITQDPWTRATQETFQIIIPFTLLDSIMSLIGNLCKVGVLVWIPYSDTISSFVFELMGLMVMFLIPYLVLRKKGFDSRPVIAGFTALSAYLTLCMPTTTEAGLIVFAGPFSASGLFISIIVGMLSAATLLPFLRHELVKDDGVIPTYITSWSSTFLPVARIVILTTPIAEYFGINLFKFLATILAPILTLGQPYVGFLLCYFVIIFLFTFGMNAQAVAAAAAPVWNMRIQANIDVVTAGGSAAAINTTKAVFSGWLNIGGLGYTFLLAIFALISKNRRLEQAGRAVAVPALLNINEPTAYDLPIAWNLLLMTPFIAGGVITPTIVCSSSRCGLRNISPQLYQMSFLPIGISAYFASSDFRGILLWIIVPAVAILVCYPLWEACEKRELEQERKESQVL